MLLEVPGVSKAPLKRQVTWLVTLEGGGAPMPILRPVKRRGSPPHFFSLHKSNNRAENIAVFICPSSTQVKLKIKVHPRTGHEGPDGE